MPNRLWMPLLAVAFAACSPNTAEVRCGTSACGANQRCEPKNLVCVLDEAPELIIASPRMGALVAGDTLMVEGTVRDDNGPASLELSLDGSQWFALKHTGASFSAKVGLPTLDGQPQKIFLRAHDAREQATKVEITVQVDNVAPQLSVAYPVDGAALGLAWFAGAGQIVGRVVDGSGLTSLTVDVGEGPVAAGPTGDEFAWTWPAPAGEDGVAHAVVVTAVDLAGNRTQVTRAVTVDVVAPEVSFGVPAEDALLGPAFFSGGGIVRGTVTPGARVFVELGQGPVPALVTDAEWSVIYRPGALDYAPRKLEVTAVDAAGNTTRAERVVIVDVVAPKVAFTGTLQGARLNIAAFPQGDDVVADWSVADGDAQVEVKSGGAAAANPLRIATAPTDNPKAYAVTLIAEDRAGNSAQASVGFAVDRVAPTVTSRWPQADARNVEASAGITFSEPMTGGAGLVLSPSVLGGTWTQPNTYEVNGLPHDTVFVRNVGPVTDLFGNPLAAEPATKFHTAPAMPPFNAALMTDVAKVQATADADGVFHFFTTSPTTPATYRWTRVNPKTGAIEDHKPATVPTLALAFSKLQVFASARANPDLSPRRISGATTVLPGVLTERKGWTRIDDQTPNADLGVVGIIPAPAMTGEGTGLGEVGYLKHIAGSVFYTRAGKPDLAMGMQEATAMGVAATRWEVVEAAGTVLKRRSYQCVPGIGGFPGSCALSPLMQFNDLGPANSVSVAVGEHCSLYAYETSAGTWAMRAEPWQTSCGNKTCTGISWVASFPAGSDVKVASDGGNTFVYTERTGTTVRVARMNLTQDCQGSDNQQRYLQLPIGADFKPVVHLGSLALAWVDGTDLKVAK